MLLTPLLLYRAWAGGANMKLGQIIKFIFDRGNLLPRSLGLLRYCCSSCCSGQLWKMSINYNKLDQNGSNWIRLDQIGSNWIKLDQIGSNWHGLDKNSLDKHCLTNIFLTNMVLSNHVHEKHGLDKLGLDKHGFDKHGLDMVLILF